MPKSNPIPDAELAVLHESLELAEVIERQLPKYLREIEDERDQLRAEVERLRGERGSLETLIVDAHFRAFGSRHYAYVDPRSACDLLVAATSDEHDRRIKAEALRATAKELESLRDHIQEYIGPDDARDDIRRICLNRAKDLREEADRLEKEVPNGR